MASYATSSPFTDLDGTCEINAGNCSSYTSSTLGAGIVINLPGGCFEVEFPGPNRAYKICATPSGSGFVGTAMEKGDDSDGEEAWTATAIAQPAVSGRS